MEVITGVARRRAWQPVGERSRIVAQSYCAGASATAVAVRNGRHANSIFAMAASDWRTEAALVGQGAGVCTRSLGVCDRVGRSVQDRRSDHGHCRRDLRSVGTGSLKAGSCGGVFFFLIAKIRREAGMIPRSRPGVAHPWGEPARLDFPQRSGRTGGRRVQQGRCATEPLCRRSLGFRANGRTEFQN